MSDWAELFARLPLVAILRGLTAAEAPAVGDTLVEAGFTVIEVPLNSPGPLDSIAVLAKRLAGRAVVGAGTVRTPAEVAAVAQAGGRLIVMPHGDCAVIAAAKDRGLVCAPGVATPTEAFAALAAGADALKLFPAEMLGPPVVKAWRAVLPPEVPLIPVGGIVPESMAAYRRAGAAGFGLGSALYRPGLPLDDLAARAAAFVDAWKAG